VISSDDKLSFEPDWFVLVRKVSEARGKARGKPDGGKVMIGIS
jgi:hypothetical protein